MIARMLLHRTAGSAFVLLAVAVVVYWGTVILPGDALTASLPMDILATMSAEELSRRRAELGLDRPHLVQFLDWIGRMVTLDFGRTLVTKAPVLDRIAHPILNSLILAGIAAFGAPLVATALAVGSVIRPHGFADTVLSGTTLVA